MKQLMSTNVTQKNVTSILRSCSIRARPLRMQIDIALLPAAALAIARSRSSSIRKSFN
jgi:hypothetical protein